MRSNAGARSPAFEIESQPALTRVDDHVARVLDITNRETSLPPGQEVTLEVKILVLRGSLNNVLEKAILQRNFLK